MKTNTSTTKLLAICMAMILLILTYHMPLPIYGPGLSRASALQQLDTMTDASFIPQTPFTPPVDETTSTSTTQLTNILVTIKSNVSTIGSVEFDVVNTSDVSLVWFDSSINNYITAVDDKNDTRVYFKYEPYTNQGNLVPIVRLVYTSSLSYEAALAKIDFYIHGGTYTNGTQIPINSHTALSVNGTYLGDADGNGSIEEADASRILQHVTGTPLTGDALLAADVNYDGTVTSNDALLVRGYSNGTKLSFFGNGSIVPLTIPTTAPIVTGKIYRLKNVASNKYLTGNTTDTTCDVNVRNVGNTAYSVNFNASYNISMLELVNVANNQYVGMNSSNDWCYLPDRIYPASVWRMVTAPGGYYIVNNANRNYMLTANGASRDLGTAVWQSELRTVTLKYRYDFGYQYRFNGSGSAAATATREQLDTLQEQTATILNSVFGVDVELDTSARFCSWSDLCNVHPDTSPTATEVMNELIADPTLLRDGSNSSHPCTHCNSCTRTGSAGIPTLTNAHHRNASANLGYYASKKTNPEPAVWVLFSGYGPCYNGDGSHKYNTIRGMAAGSWQQTNGIWNRPCGVFHRSTSTTTENERDYRDRLTALHEISHCLGAVPSAYSLIDDDHGDCVMSYNRNNKTLFNIWISGQNYGDLFCTPCEIAINNFMKYY